MLETRVVQNSASEEENWWRHQIIKAAKQHHYFADLDKFRRWVQLRLDMKSINVPRWHIIVSFHHKESRAGLMAAVVFLTTSESGYEEERTWIPRSANEFTYSSHSKVSDEEFRAWLLGWKPD